MSEGRPLKRRNAAIRNAVIPEMFVGESDLGLLAGDESQGWIDAEAIKIDSIAESCLNSRTCR